MRLSVGLPAQSCLLRQSEKSLAQATGPSPPYGGFIEPLFALIAILYHRQRFVRVTMAAMFLGFITYLLVFVEQGLDCKCFGYLRGIPVEYILNLDILLLLNWFWLSVADQLKIECKAGPLGRSVASSFSLIFLAL